MSGENRPPGIPKTERVWVTRTTEKGDTFYITSKETDRTVYFLYKLTDGKAVKQGKGSPEKLMEDMDR